jgi:hypothetical protein
LEFFIYSTSIVLVGCAGQVLPISVSCQYGILDADVGAMRLLAAAGTPDCRLVVLCVDTEIIKLFTTATTTLVCTITIVIITI